MLQNYHIRFSPRQVRFGRNNPRPRLISERERPCFTKLYRCDQSGCAAFKASIELEDSRRFRADITVLTDGDLKLRLGPPLRSPTGEISNETPYVAFLHPTVCEGIDYSGVIVLGNNYPYAAGVLIRTNRAGREYLRLWLRKLAHDQTTWEGAVP
jgi:hypothetical protein